MKVSKEEKSKKLLIAKILKSANEIDVTSKFKKNKYHSKKIEGEELPQSIKDRLNKPLLAVGASLGVLIVLIGTYIINYFTYLLKAINSNKNGIKDLDFGFSFNYFHVVGDSKNFIIMALIIIFGVMILVYGKLNHESEKNLVYGQKGDSRFATIQEIKEQYIEIPERKKSFKGVGGVPISHYKDKYYIDVDTVNSLFLGASRSGKGETSVVPLIDNLSRAEEQSNMVVNDPKGELFSASKETLEERGYRVLVLNIDDPLQSMSFNPLQLVIDAWADKDFHEASKRANSLTAMLFASGMGTENEFFYKSAKSAVNAIILTIVEYCFDNDCIEKITMYNVAQMLNELGSLFYVDPSNPMKEKNALDEYFNTLPQGNQAKIQYGSTSFAGDKAKGSILSTASQGIEMFTSDLFGKLTSKMSIDLKEIGFPKSLRIKLDPKMVSNRVDIKFLRRKDNNVYLINQYRIKVKSLGLAVLNFDEQLIHDDLLEISYEENGKKYRSLYSIKFPQRKEGNYDTKLVTKKFKPGKNFSDLDVKSIDLKYTDQPTAVFMVIPDYDTSNHVISSIFISQMYTELASNCKDTPNKKCFRRVHNILDEFGNMPEIDNMDGKMTVCLGRNIIFNLFLQSYTQLDSKYKEGAKTIKENCQNHILIMSNDDETIEEISKKCGNKTVTNKSSNSKHLDTDSSITSSAESERIITFERASQLIEGEQIVIRSLHRQDKNRNKIRPFPIFNSKETNMPYRYQFLNDDFDTRRDINEIDIECDHIDLSLESNLIQYGSFIKDLRTRIEYSITNNIQISKIDYEEYRELPTTLQNIDETLLIKHLEKNNTNDNQDLSESNMKIKSYLNECYECTLDVLNILNSESKDLKNVKKPIIENVIENEFIQALLDNRVEIESVAERKNDICLVEQKLEAMYLILQNPQLKSKIIRLKNSIGKLKLSI